MYRILPILLLLACSTPKTDIYAGAKQQFLIQRYILDQGPLQVPRMDTIPPPGLFWFSHTPQNDSIRTTLLNRAHIEIVCAANHGDGIQCRLVYGQWFHDVPPPVDSTWCPIFQHDQDCRFRKGPWRKKGHDKYVRYRQCMKHKTKQSQTGVVKRRKP